ncbi:DUF1236 domain-containing protein [Roseivivax sediminis]|uniref:SH3 domain-containing protein n=1 Tax=Roseivivax sediminis TaxID=936889 RepID=A0A1I1WZ44_9RHOB|nr:DUF1236 domain-containing protein [Roseivivax sediminis]SFD98360.1 SH3 domain-containing protein [Roseivivax sediminis]
MTTKSYILAAATLGVLATPLAAQTAATATTDLNFRAGPGPQYATQGIIPSGESVDVAGCLEDGAWCEVIHDGMSGWAYSTYLTTPVEEQPMAITEAPTVETVIYEADAVPAEETVGTITAGDPAAVSVGTVDETTVTYVRENPVDPVWLDGEVAVGATLPESVEIYRVPDADVSYVVVNQQPVIVDPATGRIVQVLR